MECKILKEIKALRFAYFFLFLGRVFFLCVWLTVYEVIVVYCIACTVAGHSRSRVPMGQIQGGYFTG